MNRNYSNLSLALGVPGLCLQAAGKVLLRGAAPGWGVAALAAGTGLLLAGLACYAKAKGRSPAWCLLGLLSVVGLIVLALLQDRSAEAHPSRWQGRVVAAVCVVCLAAAGALAYWSLRYKAESAKPAAATAKAERGPVRLAVASTGRVVSNLDVDIKCRASGEVIKLPFDVSDPVKAGDLLFELDPTDMQRVVDRAKAALAQSQAKLASAKQNLVVSEAQLAVDRKKADASLKSVESRASYARLKANRVKETLEKNLSSQDEYDAANDAANQAEADLTTARVHITEELKVQELAIELRRQEVRLAEAQVDADKVALADAQQQLGYTRVVSPIAGVVSARNVQMGTIIASGISNVGGGTTALTVSDLSRIFVIASVDESDIGKVAGGQPVTVTADAFTGKRFRGKVVQIATRGVNASNVVTFDVKIEVEDRNKALLKPEMTANVEVVAAEKADVLLVPAEAVSRQRGKQTVQVVASAGAAPEEREVETGINDGAKVEILKGLAEGETVVLNKAADSKWTGGNQGPRPPMFMGGPPRR